MKQKFLGWIWVFGLLLICAGCGQDKISVNVPTVAPVTVPDVEPVTVPTMEPIEVPPIQDTGKDGTIGYNFSKEGVTFSAQGGVFQEEFVLTLTSDTSAKIYYTTDGSDPSKSDTRKLYETGLTIQDAAGNRNVLSAVSPTLFDAANSVLNSKRNGFESTSEIPSRTVVDKCNVIRAVAYYEKERQYSEVSTETYFVGDMQTHIDGIKESCEAAGRTLAVISVTMAYEDLFDPETGIYVKGNIYDEAVAADYAKNRWLNVKDARQYPANYTQRGREWERSAHLDFFESDGDTMTQVLSQDCGIRIQGNFSRSDLQKSFRLYARSDYGENRFRYEVFGDTLKNDAGEVKDSFKTLILKNGGNYAFGAKFNDSFWQELTKEYDCDTQATRPCVVYLNGEYWGLYLIQEDYSDEYFKDTHDVDRDAVLLYKGDAEKYDIGYKLDLGELPPGETDTGYYFRELTDFFETHTDLTAQEDYDAFCKLVDPDSVRDYFAAEIWINNKWDWPGKNWAMWKTSTVSEDNAYADGRWRFVFCDMEFGGCQGASEAATNTIKEDNYKPKGLLDRNTNNPAVLCYVYLMSNPEFREEFKAQLHDIAKTIYEYDKAKELLDTYWMTYAPLYDQNFARFCYSDSSAWNYECIRSYLEERPRHISILTNYIDYVFAK